MMMMMEAAAASTTTASSSTVAIATLDDFLNDEHSPSTTMKTITATATGGRVPDSLHSSSSSCSECSSSSNAARMNDTVNEESSLEAAANCATVASRSTKPLEKAHQQSDSSETRNEEKEEELLLLNNKKLLDAVDLLAKFASLDASVYHTTLSRSLHGIDTGMSRRKSPKRRTVHSDENDDDEKEEEHDDDLRQLFTRLESIQTRHEFQQTSIPNLILSLHRWQAQLHVLQSHQSQHVQEVQALQNQLTMFAKREVAYKTCCIKLQKRCMKLSTRLHDKKLLLHRARDYCCTVQQEALQLREQNAIYQLQAHEQIMTWQQKNQQQIIQMANNNNNAADAFANDNKDEDDIADDFDYNDYDLRLRLGSTDTGTGTCSSSSNISNEFSPDSTDATGEEEEEEDIDSSMHSQSTGTTGGCCRIRMDSSSCSSMVTNSGVAVVRFGPAAATTTMTNETKNVNDDEPSESSITSTTTTSTSTSISETTQATESSLSPNASSPSPPLLLLQELPHVASRTISPTYQIRFSRHTEQLGIRIRSIPLDELPQPPPKPLIASEALLLPDNDEDNHLQQQQQKPSSSLLRLSPTTTRGSGDSSNNSNTGSSSGFFNHFLMGNHSNHHGGQQQQESSNAKTSATTTSSNTGYAFVVSGFGSNWDETRNPIKPTLGARILNINGQDVDTSWTLMRVIHALSECQQQKKQQRKDLSLDDNNNNSESSSKATATTTTTTSTVKGDKNYNDIDYFTITFRNDPLSKQQKESIILANSKNNNNNNNADTASATKDRHLDCKSNRPASAASHNVQVKPESTAATAESTHNNHSSFSLTFLKLGSTNHQLQQQPQRTAVAAVPTGSQEETTESTLAEPTEGGEIAVDRNTENKNATPTMTATNINSSNATMIKDKPKSSRGFLSSWMNEYEPECNNNNNNNNNTSIVSQTTTTTATAGGTVPSSANNEYTGCAKESIAAITGVTCTTTSTTENTAETEEVRNIDDTVESSKSSISVSIPVPSPPVVVVNSTLSNSNSLGFHAPRIHLPFWSLGSNSNNNNNISGTDNKVAAASAKLNSIESHDAGAVLVSVASETKNNDQTNDPGSQDDNGPVVDSSSSDQEEIVGSEEGIPITDKAAEREETRNTDTATSSNVAQCHATVDSSKSKSAVPSPEVDKHGATSSSRSSISSGTTLGFHAPRIHLPFWNMGNNSNSVAHSKLAVAVAELKGIESDDVVVTASKSEDNGQTTEEGNRHQVVDSCTKTTNTNSDDANSRAEDTSTMSTTTDAPPTPQQQLQHQQHQETTVDVEAETCSSNEDEASARDIDVHSTSSTTAMIGTTALHETKSNNDCNNLIMSKMLGGFSNPFM